MCGRYSFAIEDDLIMERFGIRVRTAIYKATYNCAPSQDLAVISNGNPGSLSFYRWGLIPYWAKDPAIGNRMINARSETLLEKASFKYVFRRNRCLVLADSFFEWKKDHGKIPYRILLKSRAPFAMAGIWDRWVSNTGEIVHSFAILTTKANELMLPIHDRMPVMLLPEDEKAWLEKPTETELTSLLKPYPPEAMEAYPISCLVNSPQNNGPDIIKPLTIDS
ncbi:MAG: SOS response-associated peptidase [Saccharofermentanaceae bacterium]|jgi:putative SOS response-associated peptidase YedK|nr:SOS response-associated peptidase [Bacteroidales bacterium]